MRIKEEFGQYYATPKIILSHYCAIKGFNRDTASLYGVMIDFANEDDGGVAWPSLSRLERITQMTRPTVIKHLKTLVSHGLLTPVPNAGKKNKAYKVNPPLSEEEFARKYPDVIKAIKERNARLDQRDEEDRNRRRERKKKGREQGKRGRNGLVRNADEQKREERKPAEESREKAAPPPAEKGEDKSGMTFEELVALLGGENGGSKPKHPPGFEDAYDAYYMNEQVRRTRFHDGARYHAKDGYYVVDGKRHIRIYDAEGKAVVKNPERWLAARVAVDYDSLPF